MLELEEQVNQLINQIVLKAENQHELLIGQCRSQVKLTNTQEHILMLLAEGRKTLQRRSFQKPLKQQSKVMS